MRRFAGLIAAAVIAAGLVAGCGGADEAHTLHVLAGSELRDLEPMLPDIERATGVKLVFDYIGTLEGAEKIAGGDSTDDAAWFSHGKYLSLLPGAGSKIAASEFDHAQPGHPGREAVGGQFVRLDEQPQRDLEGHPGQGRRRVVPLCHDQPGGVQQRFHRAGRRGHGLVRQL